MTENQLLLNQNELQTTTSKHLYLAPSDFRALDLEIRVYLQHACSTELISTRFCITLCSAKETIVGGWSCVAITWNANRGTKKQLFSQYSKFFWEICAEESNKCISNHWHTLIITAERKNICMQGVKTTLQIMKRKMKRKKPILMMGSGRKTSSFSWRVH